MRCVTSSQTAERLLLVLGFLGQLQRPTMAEGGWGLMSRPPDDVSTFNDLAPEEVDLLFDDDPDLNLTSSSGQSRHAPDASRDPDSGWEDRLQVKVQVEAGSPLFPDLPVPRERSLTHAWVGVLPLEMERALRAAVVSGTLTPLLKEELRCKIQLRRLEHGQDEMTPDFSVKPAAMSVEEVVKRNRKMQQNRMSAQRSRDRQKSLERDITARLQQLERDNQQLEGQAKALRHACHVARQWLHQHRACLDRCSSLTSADPVPDLALDSCGSSAFSGSFRHNSESSPEATISASRPHSLLVPAPVTPPVLTETRTPLSAGLGTCRRHPQLRHASARCRHLRLVSTRSLRPQPRPDCRRAPYSDCGRAPYSDCGRAPYSDCGRAPYSDCRPMSKHY